MCRCAAAIARAVVAFLDAVLVGFLLSCFRPRPRRGSGCRGDRAEEVIWDDERGRDGKYHEDLADSGGIYNEELRQEANYLKLCGTISGTPGELQNECDSMPTSAPATNCASLFEANSFEGCEEQHSPSELSIEDTHNNKLLDQSGSPFATPLVLRDDMQTPGTIYTSHRGNFISGKRVQTRNQFVYPVLRPIENRLQKMELTEDSSPSPPSNPPKRRNLEADSVNKPNQKSSTSVVKSGFSKTPSSFPCKVKEALSPEELLDGRELSKTNSNEKNAALSLSHWVKSSSTEAENQGDVKGAAGDPYNECSFPTERHVFNASDLNWILRIRPAFQPRDLSSMPLILTGILRIRLLVYPRHGMAMVFPTQPPNKKRIKGSVGTPHRLRKG